MLQSMTSHDSATSPEWAHRVNRAWIVRNELSDRADEWLNYLQSKNDPRLADSCRIAHVMCQRRNQAEDPKPWFYSGLFSNATIDEAKLYLTNHRLTLAVVPAMWNEEEVKSWISEISPETKGLLERLRAEVIVCGQKS
jgi:hypothetical protein